jgi:hypothetical protein
MRPQPRPCLRADYREGRVNVYLEQRPNGVCNVCRFPLIEVFPYLVRNSGTTGIDPVAEFGIRATVAGCLSLLLEPVQKREARKADILLVPQKRAMRRQDELAGSRPLSVSASMSSLKRSLIQTRPQNSSPFPIQKARGHAGIVKAKLPLRLLIQRWLTGARRVYFRS